MASKSQYISELYQSTAARLMESSETWAAFLRSACRNYKCRFDEQVLIFAQRPDATAVLEIEKWNRSFGRWVNRGAHGIAVFDDESGGGRLKHYFDISDTHDSRHARPVHLWQMKPEYEAETLEALENAFGELTEKEDIPYTLLSVASYLVEDNMADYLRDLLGCWEGSRLAGLGEEAATRVFSTMLVIAFCPQKALVRGAALP